MSASFGRRGLATATLHLALLGVLGCGADKTSCAPVTASSPSSGSMASVADPVVLSEVQAQKLVGISVAIARNGNTLYAQGYGYADLSTCQPAQPTAEFQIGSITKQFTAASILQLQNAGALNIDNPVSTYLPSYSFDSRITLRMLLNQTSGLPDYLTFPSANSWINGVAESTVLPQIAQAGLAFTPGSAYAYSNSNYFVLGSVIEAVSSVTYSNYLAAHIFQPVGLNHTSYLQPSGAASPYRNNGQSAIAGIIPDPSLFFSAGALWSNVQDLVAWDAALRNGTVIPPSLFTVMVTPPAVPDFQQGALSDYAMGWVRTTELGRPFVWHNGETYSYTSFNGVFLDDGFSVSVLTNMAVNENTPLLGLGEQLINAICTASATAGSC